MPQHPWLEQHPGYAPPPKPHFWTRTKTAIAAGIGGLVMGLLIGAGASTATEEPKADDQPEVSETSEISEDDVAEAVEDGVAEAVEEAVEDAVSEETARMQEKLDRQRVNAKARLESAKARAELAAERAITKAVAKVRAEERAKAAQAVAAAEAEAQQQAPVPLTSGGGTDPMFDYCYEVVAAGYGPYHQGQDPEYDWYDDADGDGTVCE